MSHQVLHQLVIHGYEVTVGWANQPVGHYHVTLESLSVQVQQEMYILGSKLLIAVLLIRLRSNKIPLPSKNCGKILASLVLWNKSISFTIGKVGL